MDIKTLYVRIIEVLFVGLLIFRISACSKEINYSDNHAKVLILGAGAAGIKAAQVFHDNGMDDFLIIEGADCIGGRVKKETFANVTVELGGQWVSPGYSDIVNWVLNDWQLEVSPVDWDSVTLRDINGHVFTDQETGSSWDRLEEAQIKANATAKDIVINGKPDISVKAALQLGGWLAKTPLEKVMEWYSYDFETSERTDVQSLLSVAFINYEENTFIVTDQRGYSAIFHEIAPFLTTPMFANHTRLKQRVTKIDYGDENKLVSVYSDDGIIYTGDYALVTFSVGVLRSGLVEFKPELPDWKMEEIYQIHMQAYGTIYMKFPETFWDNDEQVLHINDRYNYFTYFLNLGAYGHLPNDTNILVAHILGEDAWRVEYQSEEETKEEVESILQRMYGLNTPPRATEFMVVTDWLQNPLTLGAFSGWPVEISQECFLKLKARVGQIFFGGEATDEVYFSYVLGALRSGEREANKILECMNGKECPEYEPSPDKCDCNESSVTRMNSVMILSMIALPVLFQV